MLALSRFRNSLLGAAAVAAVLGSIIAPAASAAQPSVSAAPAPVLQQGPEGVHPISVRLLSVYVHDDGDGFGQGAGEWKNGLTFIQVSGASTTGGKLHLDNGNGWTQINDAYFGTDRTQQYFSDNNYPMTQNVTGYNKFFGHAQVGANLKLYSSINEHDNAGMNAGTGATTVRYVPVPEVGQERIVSYDVESGSGFNAHLRATFTVRIATAA